MGYQRGVRRRKLERLIFGLLIIIAAVFTTSSDTDKRSTETTETTQRESEEAAKKQRRLERLFRRSYHVEYSNFKKLLKILHPALKLDARQAARHTGCTITPAVVLQCCLRYLAVGRCEDIRNIVGVSSSTFYRIVCRVIDAINAAVELKPRFPKTGRERAAAAAGFRRISAGGVIRNCVGAIDGWLCPVKVSSKDECRTVVSFFSGHYQRYGLNVQACADHQCRITAFCVRSPGGMNDALAFKQWNLSRVVPRWVVPISSLVTTHTRSVHT